MSVLEWLLAGDPAIRWQVLRDLADAAPARRRRRACPRRARGWGARLLAAEGDDGLWDGGACFPARRHGR